MKIMRVTIILGGGGGHCRSKSFFCKFVCKRNGNFGPEISGKNCSYIFLKKGWEGGGSQKPFGNFSKIHPFWRRQASLIITIIIVLENFFDSNVYNYTDESDLIYELAQIQEDA